MTTQELISMLDEKMEKATKGEWCRNHLNACLRFGRKNDLYSCDESIQDNHEAHPIDGDEYFIISLVNSYETLKKAAMAGSELAEAVEKMGPYSEMTLPRLVMQRDAALSAYRNAIN